MSDETTRWMRAKFKGSKVWAEVDSSGRLLAQNGLVRIRYQKEAKKSYSTIKGRVKLIPGSAMYEMEGPLEEPGGKGSSPGEKSPGGGSTRGASRVGKAIDANSAILGGSEADLWSREHLHLWGDGACSGNPGPAGAGTVLVSNHRMQKWSTWLGQSTNNVAELVAVQQGVQVVADPASTSLVVHTDSQYVIGVLARGWKAKANQDLVAELKSSLGRFKKVIWHWVRGHEGVDLNEECDQLAREAIERKDSWRGDEGSG